MQLVPLEQRTRQVMSEIVVSGRGARVTNIETSEPNGDRSVMTVVEEAP
jgi:hypothetical protein